MRMDKFQAKRFCLCLDSLTMFANERLSISDTLYDARNRCLRDSERTKVNEALWADPEPIIDAYLAENPDNLSPQLLCEVASWKDALPGRCFLADVGPTYTLVTYDETCFAVVGITQEIREIIQRVPDFADMTLLPFEGLITYAMQIITYDVEYGPGIRESMAQWRDDALAGKKITGASGFIEASREIRRHRQDRDMEELEKRMQREYEREHGIPLAISSGYHMSPLAKLTPEERDGYGRDEVELAAAFARAAEQSAAYLEECWDNVSEWAMVAEPVESIHELVDFFGEEAKERLKDGFLSRMLESENANLIEMAEALSEKPASFFAEMAEGAANLYTFDDLIGFLDVFYGDEYELYKRLAHSGYSFDIAKDDFTHSLNSSLKRAEPFARVFYHDDVLTVVTMEEYRELFDEVDWDEQDRRRQMTEHALDTAQSMAFFCGIAETADVYRQFLAWYPDEDLWGSEDEFTSMLSKASINRDIVDIGFVCSEPNGYEDPTVIVSFDVLAVSGAFDGEAEDEDLDGVLDTIIDGLMVRHKTVGFNGLPDDAKGVDPLEYCYALPQVQRLETFLYERVPDEEEDDRNYVENAVEEIVNAVVQSPGMPDKLLKAIMDEEIVSVGSFEEMQELVECFMHINGALPCWYNYGCPPNVLHDKALGKKTFYDELGRPLKVGRNDPCPCGSGKKYKKCCGRNV